MGPGFQCLTENQILCWNTVSANYSMSFLRGAGVILVPLSQRQPEHSTVLSYLLRHCVQPCTFNLFYYHITFAYLIDVILLGFGAI